MNVKDEQQWQAFRHHVRTTGGPGMKKMLSIFIHWSEAVQASDTLYTYSDALGEMDEYPHLSAMDIGELFVMAIQFWPNGEEFFRILSPLEAKIVKENFEVKILAQQEKARKAGERADQARDTSSA